MEKRRAEMDRRIEEHLQFLDSDENRIACMPFISECQRMAEISKMYTDQYQLLYDKLRAESVRVEYGKGGTIMGHRGYYNPSLTKDLVISNANRGRLLKRVTASTKPDYKYWFYADGKLTVVDGYARDLREDAWPKEIILYQGDKEIGITFQNEYGIQAVSECIRRDNKLITYILSYGNIYEDGYSQYMREDYRYTEEGLNTADCYEFLNPKFPGAEMLMDSRYIKPILRHSRYSFTHDEEGYLSKYTTDEYKSTGERIEYGTPRQWHDVPLKRKV